MLEERLVSELVKTTENIIKLLHKLNYDYRITSLRDGMFLEILSESIEINKISLLFSRNNKLLGDIKLEVVEALIWLEEYLIKQDNNTITEDF